MYQTGKKSIPTIICLVNINKFMLGWTRLIKVVVSEVCFPWRTLTDSFQKYWRSKNPAIPLAETSFWPDLKFSALNWEKTLWFCTILYLEICSRPTKDKFGHAWVRLALLNKSSNLRSYFSLVASYMQKLKDTDWLLPEILLIKKILIKKKICGVRDSFPVRKLHNSCYDMQNIWAKQTVLMVACKVKAVSNSSKSL